jgi:hypothetical protein
LKRIFLEIIGFSAVIMLIVWAFYRATAGSNAQKNWLGGQDGVTTRVYLLNNSAVSAAAIDQQFSPSAASSISNVTGETESVQAVAGLAGGALDATATVSSTPESSPNPDPSAVVRVDSAPTQGAPQKIADLWFLPNSALNALSKRNFALVKRGECSEQLKVSKDFVSFVSAVLPDLNAVANPASRAADRGPAAADRNQPLNMVSFAYHVLAATLFVRLENEYLQIQATWNQNVPSSYSIRSLSFSTPTLQGTPKLRQFEFLDTTRRYDIAGVREVFRQIAALGSDGAVVAQQVAHFDGKSQRVVRYFGSVPVSYDAPNEFCRLDLAANSATCDCPLR